MASVPRVPPYTEADWQREWDDGRPLSCPRCGSSDDFGPRQGVRADRSFRPYRACKRCGMFQEADITPSVDTNRLEEVFILSLGSLAVLPSAAQAQQAEGTAPSP